MVTMCVNMLAYINYARDRAHMQTLNGQHTYASVCVCVRVTDRDRFD